jgi:hypothetical protein
VTSVPSLALVPAVMASSSGFACWRHSGLATHPVPSMGSRCLPRPLFAHRDAVWCRTIQPACHRLRLLRPRLRSRLTLGRLPLPRNPQAFGGSGSRTSCATHSGIRSSERSTCLLSQASLPSERSPTMSSKRTFTASVGCLSLVTLSAPLHSTSELLRTLSMMAASKPTSWLSLRTDFL